MSTYSAWLRLSRTLTRSSLLRFPDSCSRCSASSSSQVIESMCCPRNGSSLKNVRDKQWSSYPRRVECSDTYLATFSLTSLIVAELEKFITTFQMTMGDGLNLNYLEFFIQTSTWTMVLVDSDDAMIVLSVYRSLAALNTEEIQRHTPKEEWNSAH